MKTTVVDPKFPTFTQKQAIELGLVNKKQLDEERKRAINAYINTAYRRDYVTKAKEKLQELIKARDLERSQVCTHYYSDTLGLRISSAAYLPAARAIFKEFFGQWNDVVSGVFPYDDCGTPRVEITFRPTFELPIRALIELSCDEVDMPDGVLKKGCKIVADILPNRKVVCSMNED